MIYSILYYDGFYTWTDFLSQDTKILSPVEVNTWTQINKQFYYMTKLWFQEMHVDSEIPLKATRKHLEAQRWRLVLFQMMNNFQQAAFIFWHVV